MNSKQIDTKIDEWASRHLTICKILTYATVPVVVSLWFLVNVQFHGASVAVLFMVPVGLFILYLNWNALKLKFGELNRP